MKFNFVLRFSQNQFFCEKSTALPLFLRHGKRYRAETFFTDTTIGFKIECTVSVGGIAPEREQLAACGFHCSKEKSGGNKNMSKFDWAAIGQSDEL